MQVADNIRFNEFADSIGNRYIAIQLISEWVRQLSAEYKEYYITESKLLEWVVTGTCPYKGLEFEKRKRRTLDDHIDEFLEWILDDEVSVEVKSLYKESVRNHHLQKCDNKSLSEYRISRVNILLRLLWYSPITEGGIYTNG